MSEPRAMAGMRSAINRESIERARRAQEKLGEYLTLLDRVKELERDPDIALFLVAAGDGDVFQKPAGRRALSIAPADNVDYGNEEKEHAQQPAAPSRGKGKLLIEFLRMLEFEAEPHFGPEDVVQNLHGDHVPEALMGLTEKQINNVLRHLGTAGLVNVVEPGKRGKGGRMPRYKLVDPPPEPRRTSLDMEDI